MSIARSIPIQSVRIDETSSVRMAVAEIERFLSLFYSFEDIEQNKVAKKIAGQWYSRVSGFHERDDFLHLVRDFLQFLLGGGERTQMSDALAYYFSGFLPTYGAARAVIGMVHEGQRWHEVQAFMHHLGYGGAKTYVQTFDWSGGKSKANAEVKAWVSIMKEQAALFEPPEPAPVVLAFLQPGTVTDVPTAPYEPPKAPPATQPAAPQPQPRPKPAPSPGGRLIPLLTRVGSILLLPLMLTGDTPQHQKDKLLVQDTDEASTATSNTTNNECLPQTEQNKLNGEVCENDGYVIMEQALHYKRLVNPPKGKGLDGLFEKLDPQHQPNPFPQVVTVPRPGKLFFLPESWKPPLIQYHGGYPYEYDHAIYPKFVVFEAKNISKLYDPEQNPGGLLNETKRRLQETCDGKQVSQRWTENRISRALQREHGNTPAAVQKGSEIEDVGYSRWVFVCLPGGSAGEKVYVFINAQYAPGWDDLDDSKYMRQRKSPRPRQPGGTPSQKRGTKL